MAGDSSARFKKQKNSICVDETTHQSQGRSEVFWENQTLDPLAMNSFEFVARIKQQECQTMTP